MNDLIKGIAATIALCVACFALFKGVDYVKDTYAFDSQTSREKRIEEKVDRILEIVEQYE